MNAGPTAERVYDAIRRQILDHELRPGMRVEPAHLADAVSASVTPVRDALNRLLGEGLVETRQGDGYQLPALDEPLLRDRYRWNREILALALGTAALPQPEAVTQAMAVPRLADRTARLFGLLATVSGNSEHALAMERLNAQLRAVRIVEAQQIDVDGAGLAAIADAAQKGDRGATRKSLADYHRVRERAAAVIVRAAYRD